jgi:phosphatidylglycerol lysyltransferase
MTKKKQFTLRHGLAFALLLSGLANIVEAVIPKSQAVADWMEQWVPLEVSQGSRMLILLFGLVQVIVSRGIFRGKKTAWAVASSAMAVTVLLHLGRAWDWQHAFWSLILLSALLWQKKDFTASSDAASARWGLVIGGSAMATLLLYSCSTVWHYAPQARLKRDPVEIARASAGLVFFQNLAAEGHHSKRARRAFEGVQTAALAVLLGTLWLVLRPVLGRRAPRDRTDLERVAGLIAAHGRDPMDCFALMDDKRWFFHSPGSGTEGVVAYGLWRNVAVALAGPIGPEETRAEAWSAFRKFCAAQDWIPCFYCAHVADRVLWEADGWHSLHVAEDARITLAGFDLKGSAYQGLRTSLNRGHKAGWCFRWYTGSPVDHGLEAQMRLVSDDWLDAKGGTEMGFDLGSYSAEAVRRDGAACVLNGEGRLLAFATWPEYAYGRGRGIDLMRSVEESRGAMDFLILESMAFFRGEGILEVSLGNAPLARVSDVEERATPGEKVLDYLFEHFNQIYGYKPLFEFKRKYHPRWEDRYILHRSNAHLPSVAAAVVRLHAPKGLLAMMRS